MRALIVAALVAHATAARAGERDPRALFAQGRYAAAATAFQHRFVVDKKPVDGVNAVVAWRLAGRYARARATLAAFLATSGRPDGDLGERVTALEEKLTVLTGTIAFAPPLPANAIVKIDGDPPERIGGVVIVDVGAHEITVSEERCERWTWTGVVHPAEMLALDALPKCDTRGTLHVALLGDPRGPIRVDGVRHDGVRGELSLPIEAGRHRLELTSRDRQVTDQLVSITTARTTSLRVRYPWRARRSLGWEFVGSTSLMASGPMTAGSSLTPIGIGVENARWRLLVELGSSLGTAKEFQPTLLRWGHPYGVITAAFHPWLRPLWQTRRGDWRIALDFDPLAARAVHMDACSPFGVLCLDKAYLESLQLLPATLSFDGPTLHLELAVYPVGWTSFTEPDARPFMAGVNVRHQGFTGAIVFLMGFAL